MFSSFVFDNHDHLISTFNPSEHCLNANHTYPIKGSFNLLIASCSWWYSTLLFALFLPSSSLLQIVLNPFHILQPFKTWSPWVTSQMRRKAFAFMSFQTCNTSASVSSSGLFSSLKLLCDCCRCCELPFVHKAPSQHQGPVSHKLLVSSIVKLPLSAPAEQQNQTFSAAHSPQAQVPRFVMLVCPSWAVSCPLAIRALKMLLRAHGRKMRLVSSIQQFSTRQHQQNAGEVESGQTVGLGGTNTGKCSLAHSKEEASKNSLLWAYHRLNYQKGSLTKFLDQNQHWGCLLQFFKC